MFSRLRSNILRRAVYIQSFFIESLYVPSHHPKLSYGGHRIKKVFRSVFFYLKCVIRNVAIREKVSPPVSTLRHFHLNCCVDCVNYDEESKPVKMFRHSNQNPLDLKFRLKVVLGHLVEGRIMLGFEV